MASQTKNPTAFTTTGAGIEWTQPPEGIPGYCYATAGETADRITQTLTRTGYGFTIPTGSMITGISVRIEKFSSAPNSYDTLVSIVKNGVAGSQNNKYIADDWQSDVGPEYVEYSTFGLWGEDWTAENINADNFGIAIQAEFAYTYMELSVCNAEITVYYTEEASTTSTYATAAQLAAYLGTSEDNLASDVTRLLLRASEFMDSATNNRIDVSITKHATAAQSATCAQVEFWLEVGEDRDVSGPIQGYTASKVQIQYGAGVNRITPAYLAPRARRALNSAGLLYAGAYVK